ncbi:MAG: sigma-54-dependent Fis family transcriptional regulator [Deltaproteobacteria bacterium]|jgi:two-component system nitrogen regulation response regulator NtrX|nr:sigma-54-dependent Fis family transcriptional regulator [Deltaproteobacteria bacterium]
MAEGADRIGQRVVVVDDERNIRRTLQMVLDGEGYLVETFESAEAFMPRLAAGPIDVVLLDVRLPGMDGLQTLEKIREEHGHLPVVMISGHATIEEAVRAMNAGATDFMEKPLSRERVLVTVKNAVEKKALSAKIRALEAAEGGDEEMLGDSEPIRRVKEQIAKVAGTGVRVLITGESGTGKELIARAIHRASKRANGPFVKVNCAAIPSELIESELFGHERGAFSGAVQKKRGRFELADGGTLFLDEIGDMSMDAQAKVLRALQTGEVIRVGGEKSFMVDVRVLAATNKDLEDEVKVGAFREDLYFRLSVVPIVSPPLRDRGKDVLLLMGAYLDQFSREHAVHPRVTLSPEASEAIARYAFPGNVRELRNLAERLVILAENPVTLADLPPMISGAGAATTPPTLTPGKSIDLQSYGNRTLRELRELVERDYILHKLEDTSWNVTRTAEILGIERTNLHKKLKQLGIRKGSIIPE